MARSIRCNPIPATRILRNTPASHPCGWLFVFLPIPAMPIRSQGTRQGWGPTGTAAMDMRGERNEQRRDHCCRNELHTGAGARAVSGRIDHQDQGEHLRDQEIFWQLQARAGGMRAGTRWIWIYGRAGALFPDWAGVVRKLGRVPTMMDYRLHGRYSSRPLVRHFGGWTHVPAGMLEYSRGERVGDDWKDVLDVVAKHLMERPDWPRASRRTLRRTSGGGTLRPTIQDDEPFYGEPMAETPMVFSPTNEAGVAVLFGAVARDLGFRITRVQNGFPDCEAMLEVEPGRWQRKRIEFEYESRSFLSHGHQAANCNMIVCWRHNWPECPLEVVELKSAVSDRHSAVGERQNSTTDEHG